jgi:hypothetical protein
MKDIFKKNKVWIFASGLNCWVFDLFTFFSQVPLATYYQRLCVELLPN